MDLSLSTAKWIFRCLLVLMSLSHNNLRGKSILVRRIRGAVRQQYPIVVHDMVHGQVDWLAVEHVQSLSAPV